jgi:hypothetical protein
VPLSGARWTTAPANGSPSIRTSGVAPRRRTQDREVGALAAGRLSDLEGRFAARPGDAGEVLGQALHQRCALPGKGRAAEADELEAPVRR